MNKDIIVIARKEENIKRIKTIFELIGYNLFLAEDLNSAFRFIERFTPLAILLVEEEEQTTEIYLKEIKRYLPITPVIILISEKNHKKREYYLRDAYDVIEHPWTDVIIAQTLNLIEIKKIKNQEFKNELTQKTSKNFLYLFLIIFTLILLSIFIFFKLTQSDTQDKQNKTKKEIKIPSKNISGFFEKENKYYVYDWSIQSFYVVEKFEHNISSIKNFFTPYIITSIKDSGENSFLAITDNKEIKKILKDDKFREIYSITGYKNIIDLCYDGMYIWVLDDEYITKILDSEKNEIIERYILPQEIKGVNHLACNKDEIFYYKEPQIYVANLRDPVKLNKKITINKKLLSLNQINEKIFFILSRSNDSLIEEFNPK